VDADAAKILALHLVRVEQELVELRRRLQQVTPPPPPRRRAPALEDFPADTRWQVGVYER
jgi:hypothetical protein